MSKHRFRLTGAMSFFGSAQTLRARAVGVLT